MFISFDTKNALQLGDALWITRKNFVMNFPQKETIEYIIWNDWVFFISMRGVMYLTVCVHGHVVHSEVVLLQAAVSSDVQMMEHSFGCVVVVMVI